MSSLQIREPQKYVPTYHNWKPLKVQLEEEKARKNRFKSNEILKIEKQYGTIG